MGELRKDLSRYVAMAREGKPIAVVNEDGEVVAYLVAPERAHLASADKPGSPFERLVAAGQVRRATATGSLLDLMPPPPLEPGERPLSDVVREMRDEERY